VTTQQNRSRPRNARGQGSKLRDEIVSAAGRLLDENGNAEAVTLRAVAREVGVAAPSIYAHFPDREAVVRAVVDRSYIELIAAIVAARDAETGPVERLEAGVRAVLRFAADRPTHFAVMLGLPGSSDPEPNRGSTEPATVSFQLLVDGINDCVQAGLAHCPDPHLAATAIMVASHGYALLKPRKPTFPWPPDERLVSYFIGTLAGIE
jgi:AcrR family transcriptional regulator